MTFKRLEERLGVFVTNTQYLVHVFNTETQIELNTVSKSFDCENKRSKMNKIIFLITLIEQFD